MIFTIIVLAGFLAAGIVLGWLVKHAVKATVEIFSQFNR